MLRHPNPRTRAEITERVPELSLDSFRRGIRPKHLDSRFAGGAFGPDQVPRQERLGPTPQSSPYLLAMDTDPVRTKYLDNDRTPPHRTAERSFRPGLSGGRWSCPCRRMDPVDVSVPVRLGHRRGAVADIGVGFHGDISGHDGTEHLDCFVGSQTEQLREIQERLGHSTIRLTFDRYGHLLPTLDERLRDGLDATWRAAHAYEAHGAAEVIELRR